MCNINQMLKEQIQSYKDLKNTFYEYYDFLMDRLDDLEEYESELEDKKLNNQDLKEIECKLEKLKLEIKEYYGTIDVIKEYNSKYDNLHKKEKQINVLKAQIFKYKCQH